MTRRMLLIPADGPVTEVNAPTFEQMRHHLGDAYIERIRIDEEHSLAVDEDGHAKGLPINPRASLLYGTHKHGVPIVGDVLLARDGFVDDGIDWVDSDPVDLVTFVLNRLPKVVSA